MRAFVEKSLFGIVARVFEDLVDWKRWKRVRIIALIGFETVFARALYF